MNLTQYVTAAWRSVPPSMKGQATLTRTAATPATTTLRVMAVPVSGPQWASRNDGFQGGAAIESKGRRMVAIPDGAAFPPAPGQTIAYGGTTYQILGVAPLDPAGTGTPALYSLTVTT